MYRRGYISVGLLRMHDLNNALDELRTVIIYPLKVLLKSPWGRYIFGESLILILT